MHVLPLCAAGPASISSPRNRRTAPTFASLPVTTRELLFPGKCGPNSFRTIAPPTTPSLHSQAHTVQQQGSGYQHASDPKLAQPQSQSSAQPASAQQQDQERSGTQAATIGTVGKHLVQQTADDRCTLQPGSMLSRRVSAPVAAGAGLATASGCEEHTKTGMPLGLAGSRLVSHRVVVWWPLDMTAYTGTVKSYNKEVSDRFVVLVALPVIVKYVVHMMQP